MQLLFFGHQFVNRFFVQVIRYTAVNRANSSALRLFMEALAFRTFIRDDVICIYADRRILCISIKERTIEKGKTSLNGCAICDGPFNATFINCIIGTFGFTSSTNYIDEFTSSIEFTLSSQKPFIV